MPKPAKSSPANRPASDNPNKSKKPAVGVPVALRKQNQLVKGAGRPVVPVTKKQQGRLKVLGRSGVVAKKPSQPAAPGAGFIRTEVTGTLFFKVAPNSVENPEGIKRSYVRVEVPARTRLGLVADAAGVLAKAKHARGKIIHGAAAPKARAVGSIPVWLQDQSGKRHFMGAL